MKKLHARRLLKLVKFLRDLPRSKFDYSHFMTREEENGCGTVGCAMGWACTMPDFRRLGASLTVNFGGATPLQPTMRGEGDYLRVGEEIFGLDLHDTQFLFIPDAANSLDASATPKQVARHIEKFVKERCPDLFA